MIDNYDGVIYVGEEDNTDESTLEVLIKFCLCGGWLSDDNLIHDVSDIFQFIITHMVLIEIERGEITLEVMQASLILSQQEDYITVIEPPVDGKRDRSVHFGMMVTCTDIAGVWPRIDMMDQVKYNIGIEKENSVIMELIDGISHR